MARVQGAPKLRALSTKRYITNVWDRNHKYFFQACSAAGWLNSRLGALAGWAGRPAGPASRLGRLASAGQ